MTPSVNGCYMKWPRTRKEYVSFIQDHILPRFAGSPKSARLLLKCPYRRIIEVSTNKNTSFDFRVQVSSTRKNIWIDILAVSPTSLICFGAQEHQFPRFLLASASNAFVFLEELDKILDINVFTAILSVPEVESKSVEVEDENFKLQ